MKDLVVTEKNAEAMEPYMEEAPLYEAVLSKEGSWIAVASVPLLESRLELEKKGDGFLFHIYGVPSESLQQSKITLMVPEEDCNSYWAWDYKSSLISTFLDSDAKDSSNLIQTEFIQGLLKRGFTISSACGGTVSDAKLKLTLSKEAVFEGVTLNAEAVLECDHLTLRDVVIDDCHLEFKVKGGKWTATRSKGNKTIIKGDLGATVMDDDCIFGGLYEANLKGCSMGKNIGARTLDMKYYSDRVPAELAALGKAMDEESVKKMWDSINSAEFADVNPMSWRNSTDRLKG